MEQSSDKNKWYFSTTTFIIAFLCVGPFALPLAWFNPRYSKKTKIIVTIIIAVMSYLLGVLMVKSVESIIEYYSFIFQ